ncbi:MAG: glycoside hydrolase family protein, partial [Muribaculaceae bacterium]|nr:glycoside hydrolase family protein [Muribaculaceae bacterium]
MILDKNDDFHITASTGAIAPGVLVDIVSPQSRLYFDNVKPSEFIEKYAPLIRIAGKEFDIDKNARVSVYRHGTMVLPHGSDFAPMKAFEGSDLSGRSEDFLTYKYYSNAPSSDVKKSYSLPLALDDAMRSFTLARGYMATLATNPDGTGYSRCYIADDADLEVELPFELAGKVSFVRVLDWRAASKKGWVGGNGKTNPPEGYLEEQADMTASTWVYNWGTSPDWGRSPSARTAPWRNQEFVPEKWGLGGDTDWNKIANSRYFTHLLSYNEPDHREQSNVTVEEAVAEWPRHLSTGLRLGSPATTDFSWLYRFIDACDRL